MHLMLHNIALYLFIDFSCAIRDRSETFFALAVTDYCFDVSLRVKETA